MIDKFMAEKGALKSIGWRETISFLVFPFFFSQLSKEDNQAVFAWEDKG